MSKTMKSIVFLAVLSVLTNGLKALPTVADNSSADKTCKSCTSLVAFIHKLNTNQTNLLENAFVNICNDYSSLPGQQTTQTCKHMTTDLLKMFAKVNKQTFCDEISACDSNTSNNNNNLVANSVSDDPSCNFCVTVVTNIKDIVSGAPTELEVKYFVEDACHYLGSFENECVSLADEYIDTLFAYIRQSLQPKQFCQSIGACNTTVKAIQTERVADISEVVNIFPAQMPLTPLKNAEPIERVGDMECVICKRIVTYVVQELKDNRTEQAIIEALEHICSLFPQKERSKCDAFVDQYANELIHILVEEGDPDLACTLLGVCVPSSVWQSLHRPEIEREDSVNETKTSVQWSEVEVESVSIESTAEKMNKNKLCFECELLMHFIQNEIYDYQNEQEIEDFIEHKLCTRMQIVITKEACDTFVQQYGPQILNLIAQKLFDPTTVCQKEMHMCPNTTTAIPVETIQPQQDFQLTRQTEKCDLCVQLVQQMDNLLENQDVDKEIAKVVEKACHPLSRARRVECELMVESFAPYFLQMIGRMSDANQICKTIDMCYTSGGVHLLGGHKCTFGPTYWCHTIAHAESCKATHFCKSKVWKAMP